MREVNLEEGLPTAEVAIRRLTAAIHREKALGTKVFKIIHGYGSSGTGGRIRTEARRYLAACVRRGLVADFLPGEELSIFSPKARAFLAADPSLSKDRDMERHNNGITMILL